MSENEMPRGMALDIDAFERAEQRFTAEHGAEARRRWLALGAEGDGLRTLQLTVVRKLGPRRDLLEAFAWETGVRVQLVEDERRAIRAAWNGR